jgi:hypothetical protein
MVYRIAADAVVLLHFAFILFVVAGGLLVLRWPRLLWLHIPAVAWGALIELFGWICPLTPLENKLRFASGDSVFTGGFIEEYLLPLIYPVDLSRKIQLALGVIIIAINVVFYGLLLLRRSHQGETDI